ncbi:hypothetical protein ABW22_00325 [Thiobacillus denitrificans]|uniref:Uncharacterized protein n=1 Tax=Thiobacillus denitrificans TaxID=36861 RepID=A0A106BVZ2_THIDE|nr:hypothetical protein ABW22_00325 [Thiobacillus denitrificans]
MYVSAQHILQGRQTIAASCRNDRRQSIYQEGMTMMNGDWMSGWGTGYMGGWGGLGMILIVALIVIGVVAIMRK